MTLEDKAAAVSAAAPYLADASLTVASEAQVHAFVTSIYMLGMSMGRTGWPKDFVKLGERFTTLRLTRTHIPVDELVVGAVSLLLGLGFSESEVTNIMHGYMYDMVSRVAAKCHPDTARTLAIGHLEWVDTKLTKQLSTEYRVSPQALQLLGHVPGVLGPNAALGASGSSGAPDANDGLLTRGMYNWGRFVGAADAGRNSWYSKSSETTKVGPVEVSRESTKAPLPPPPPPQK